MLGDLPPEVLERILCHVEAQADLKAARLVCSTFARLALGPLFERINAGCRSSDFDRLHKIADSPHIACHVQAFRYFADMFRHYERPPYPSNDYNEWKAHRTRRRAHDDWNTLGEYEAYKSLVADQKHIWIHRDETERKALSRLFEHCRRLRAVCIVYGHEHDFHRQKEENFRRQPACNRQRSYLEVPRDACYRKYAMSTARWATLKSLAEAAQCLGRPLTHLQLRGVDMRYFARAPGSPALPITFAEGVKHLRLEVEGLHQQGGCQEFAAFASVASQSCQTLQLWHPPRKSIADTRYWLSNVLGTSYWPQLKMLAVYHVNMDTTFMSMLRDRLPALDVLRLHSLRAKACTCEEVYHLVAGMSRRLSKINLSGHHCPEVSRREYEFDDLSFQQLKHGIENYILGLSPCPDLREADELMKSL